MGLPEGRCKPGPGGAIQVGHDAVEVPLVLEPGCLGLEQQCDLWTHERDPIGGRRPELVQRPGDSGVAPIRPAAGTALL